MGLLVAPFIRICQYRKILLNTSLQEIRKKYAGSVLGMAWVVVYPLLFLGVYTLVYAFVFNVSFPGMSMLEYIFLIFSGLLLYLGFNESVMAATQSVVANSALIKNTMFPIELVPVRAVLCGQTTQASGILILIVGLVIIGKASPLMLMIAVVWILEIMMELGISWILSSLNVIVRDTQSIISIIMLMLMMASPIAYPISMIPEGLKPFVMINPIFCFIISSQQILIEGRMPETYALWGMFAWGVIPFLLGYWFFIKLKGVFIDNV